MRLAYHGVPDFNPRSPYGERPFVPITAFHCGRFQSTLPLRGATVGDQLAALEQQISIHAPLTGSDLPSLTLVPPPFDFNPRSPYGERQLAPKLIRRASKFQSTLPLRGATRAAHDAYAALCISIHAPLTGSDPSSASQRPPATYFNPRSPYGERRQFTAEVSFLLGFQSTLPLRGATPAQVAPLRPPCISIHAPLTGSDCWSRSV